MKIFLTTDTHFYHDNIKKYESRPDDFNEILVENWNKVIQPNDLVIHLGDVIFGHNKETTLPELMAKLNGKKILTLGNHDKKPWTWYLDKGFDFVCDYFIIGDVAFSHAPLTPLPVQAKENHGKEVRVNFHGHFHKAFHRVPQEGEEEKEFNDDFYNYQYYSQHKQRYRLIQIEDQLSPFLLDVVLSEL